ncbi:NAD-dependent epimerase/dehydratase family protein [Nocardioides jejuensis]|uniref:NAD-dependent epimerase/dehydratase family protein n=1 Tax=Nocardioides jejuensis TaxID=2502782 RepID=A0A4R1CIH5_9ACTN|nr:NAD-dependent epimerase/dehydratase family protein [Nocardioides jejuensis]TCJ30205.1 NAD-dependent epimerase/dehydratase family protein [Nocardioides jejuensis]
MTIAITGARGFLGWHTACRLLATRGEEAVLLGREEFADPALLARKLADVDTVIHIAGVNRAETDEEIEQGNIALAEALATALGDRPVHVVYASTVMVAMDTPYGRGKTRAGEILGALPGTTATVLMPNLFGEHGRPAYNSFIATFAHEVAHGRQPSVTGDRQIPLLHAQDAAEVLIAAAEKRQDDLITPEAEPHGISEVLDLLNEFHTTYAATGDIPDVSTKFRLDLFNTYRAALWPHGYPILKPVHADNRGELIETVRSHGGQGQAYVSSTKPGQTRGEHYHLRKIERFVVFKGEAEIKLRRLFHDEVLTFRVSGDQPAHLDMPTMWVHNIVNVGDTDVITAFWADQLLDPVNPDQYPMKVVPEVAQ